MRRVLLVPILVFALLAAGGLAALAVTLRATSAELEGRVEGVRLANLAASRLSRRSADATREVLAYPLRPSPEAAARVRALEARTDEALGELSGLPLSPRGAALSRQLLASREVSARERERLMRAVERGDRAQTALHLDRWTLAANRTTALIADVSAHHLKRLAGVARELQDTRGRALAWLVGVLAAGAAAVVGFAVLIDRWLVRPVQAITHTARHIAAERVALEVPGRRRRDELGVLARTVMDMAGALVQANAELARSVERRDEFLALAAHELKTPLSALKLHLQGAHRAWLRGTRPPAPRVVETALRHAGRLETLVQDLLTLAEIRDGRFSVARHPLDLSALVHEAAERVRGVLETAGNVLEVELAPDLACHGDRQRLRQVVTSLLVNAAEHAAGTHVSLRLARQGARAVLEIEDGGAGISAAERAAVFEPYRKGDRTVRVRGLGLGLFLAKQVVEAHGGSIAVSTGTRGGARCRVDLPAAGALAREGPGAGQGAAAPRPGPPPAPSWHI